LTPFDGAFVLAALDLREFTMIAMRILHIGAAIVAAGGVAFQLLALQPTLRSLPDDQRIEVREKIVARWFQVVMICIGLLLLTGFINFIAFKVPELRDKPYKNLYHTLFGIKFILALAVFHGATVSVLPLPRGEKYRARASVWLMRNTVFLIAIVIIAALMRYVDAIGT
jgi:hypothetical protein